MELSRRFLYIRIALAVGLALAINLALWPSDASTGSDSRSDVPPYNLHSTAFAYSKTFAKQFGLDPAGAYDFPEPVLAMRAYIAEKPFGSIAKIQYYLDASLKLHLPTSVAASVIYESSYTGFMGITEPPKKMNEFESNMDELFEDNIPMTRWQFLAFDKDEEKGVVNSDANLVISRYSKELVPGITLVETDISPWPETSIYIYVGKDVPTTKKSGIFSNKILYSKPISDQERREFLEIKVPDNIRGLLDYYDKYLLPNLSFN